MKRAALYARVSDEEQVEGYSLDAQRRAFRDFAESQEWDVYREYVEEGVSARTDDVAKRPLFQEVMKDALAHKFDVLIVHKLDRFARNARITLEYLEKLEKAGIGFVSISEQMDFSTPIGKVILANLAAFGQYYSDNLSSEVKKGMGERVKQGRWVGPVPFGYIKGDDALLKVIPEEAEMVQRAFEMYASGNYTDQQIATWCNQTGHKPRSRRRDKGERNYIWARCSVRDMLKNPFYTGKLKYQDETLPGQHTPIISQALFDAVQVVRKQHFIGPATFAPRYRTYLLKGLLRCVHCGGKVWAQHVGKGLEYYREQNSARGINCPNGNAYHRVEVLDEQVCLLVENLQLPASWRDLVQELLDSGDERDSTAKEHNRLEAKLKRIKFQFREGDIDQAEYQQEIALTKAALQAVQAAPDSQLIQLGDHIEGLVEAWAAATKEERHQLISMMLDTVYVDMEAGKIAGVKPKPEFLPLFNLKEPVRAGEINLVTGGFKSTPSPPQMPFSRIMLQ